MKILKHTLLLFLTVLFIPALGLSQNNSNNKVQEVFYTLPQDPYFSHWSYMISVGGSIFDGDVWESDGQQIIPSSQFKPTLGVNIERSFNPIFGIGVQYSYLPFSAKPDDPVQYRLKGTSNEVDLYLSINLLNLFYRSRPQKWGLFFNAGLGVAFYNAKMVNKNQLMFEYK